MEPPKLVILDLDGTAVTYTRDHSTPSAAVVDAVTRTREAGVPVAVATGRALWGAMRTVVELGLDSGLISASHGAVTYDLDADSVVRSHRIDPAEVVRRFQEVEPRSAFAVELDRRGWRHTENFPRDFTSTWADVVDVETLAATRTTRLAVRLPEGSRHGVGRQCPIASRMAADAALDEEVYDVQVGFNAWLDVGPAGISKASGASEIAAYYGVSAADTAVFGDAHNDLPMFAWAGHAVAMGNAVTEIREAADEVAPSAEQDGVAEVLNRWFA